MKLSQKIQENVNHFELLQSDIEYYLYEEFIKQCELINMPLSNTYDILNVDKLKKHFGYIHISSFTINHLYNIHFVSTLLEIEIIAFYVMKTDYPCLYIIKTNALSPYTRQ